jgi:hypothetical protein
MSHVIKQDHVIELSLFRYSTKTQTFPNKVPSNPKNLSELTSGLKVPSGHGSVMNALLHWLTSYFYMVKYQYYITMVNGTETVNTVFYSINNYIQNTIDTIHDP